MHTHMVHNVCVCVCVCVCRIYNLKGLSFYAIYLHVPYRTPMRFIDHTTE